MIYPVSSKMSVENMVAEIMVKAVVEVILVFNKWVITDFFFLIWSLGNRRWTRSKPTDVGYFGNS